MNIFKIFIIVIILASRANALTPYNAQYDLYADTSMGNFKIGVAEFRLETDGNKYIYTSEASTKSMWSALYKFSRFEQSIGTNSYNELVSRKYTVKEILGENAKRILQLIFFRKKTMPPITIMKSGRSRPEI